MQIVYVDDDETTVSFGDGDGNGGGDGGGNGWYEGMVMISVTDVETAMEPNVAAARVVVSLMTNIKVQFTDGRLCADAESFPLDGERLTFHAYSDEMKARLFEKLAAGLPIVFKITDEKPKKGSWYERPLCG